MLAVIIPAYNRPNDLRQALKSLTLQTKPRFMTYVIDDCSTEDLKSVCDEFKGQLHIYYFRMKENGGPGMARQYGLDIAARSHIDLVMFLDSDDMLYPNAVYKLTYEINHRMDDYVITPISVESQTEPGYTMTAEYASHTWLHGKIFRLDFLTKNNIRFLEGLRGNEDVNFMLKCCVCTEKISLLDEPLYLWRDSDGSITRTNGTAKDKILSEDYIIAVCEAINFMKERNRPVDDFAHYILFFYKFYQILLIKNMDLTKSKELIEEFLSYPEVKHKLSKYIIWHEFIDKVSSYTIIDKKVYFYPQTFIEWFKQFDKEGEILSEICGN